MALKRAAAVEGLRDDGHVKMTAAGFRALMACVQVALIFDEQFDRRERLIELRFDCFHPFAAHDITRLLFDLLDIAVANQIGDPKCLRQHEYERQSHQAEDFEFDPRLLRKVVGHINIEQTGSNEE